MRLQMDAMLIAISPEPIGRGIKISADEILKYFFLFSHKTGFDISSKLSPMETICIDNLHEMSKPIFWKKKEENILIFCLLNLPREWLWLNTSPSNQMDFFKIYEKYVRSNNVRIIMT